MVIIHNNGRRRVLELSNEMPVGMGTVLDFSSGNLSPLFNTSVANPTDHPSLSFSAISQSANKVFASPNGSAGVPTFRSLTYGDMPQLSNGLNWNGSTGFGELGGTLTHTTFINPNGYDLRFDDSLGSWTYIKANGFHNQAIHPSSGTSVLFTLADAGNAYALIEAGNGGGLPAKVMTRAGTGFKEVVLRNDTGIFYINTLNAGSPTDYLVTVDHSTGLLGQIAAASLSGVTWTSITGKPNSGNFIYNNTTQQTGANFNIDGNGIIGGKLLVGTGTSSSQFSVISSQGGFSTGAVAGTQFALNRDGAIGTIFNSAYNAFQFNAVSDLQLQVYNGGGGFVGYGWKVDGSANLMVGNSLIFLTTPTTSAGAYDILTRNSSTGIVEKVSSTSFTTTPAGSNTQVQFNNSGAFGASSSLTFNGSVLTTTNVAIGVGSVSAPSLKIGSFGSASGFYSIYDGTLSFAKYGVTKFLMSALGILVPDVFRFNTTMGIGWSTDPDNTVDEFVLYRDASNSLYLNGASFKISSGLTIGSVSTSTGSYDILTRNSITGAVEKIAYNNPLFGWGDVDASISGNRDFNTLGNTFTIKNSTDVSLHSLSLDGLSYAHIKAAANSGYADFDLVAVSGDDAVYASTTYIKSDRPGDADMLLMGNYMTDSSGSAFATFSGRSNEIIFAAGADASSGVVTSQSKVQIKSTIHDEASVTSTTGDPTVLMEIVIPDNTYGKIEYSVIGYCVDRAEEYTAMRIASFLKVGGFLTIENDGKVCEPYDTSGGVLRSIAHNNGSDNLEIHVFGESGKTNLFKGDVKWNYIQLPPP